MPSAPRFAERLVAWSLFPTDREAFLGDLQEEFASISRNAGPGAAARWYWTQTLASIVPNVLRRVRGNYTLRLLAETPSARLMRQSLRTFSLWMIGTPIAVSVLMIWAGAQDLSMLLAFGILAEVVGVAMFVTNMFPLRPADRETAAVNRRRSYAIWATFIANGFLRGLLAQQSRYILTGVECLVVLVALMWPKRYWPIRPPYLGREIPQALTPFVIGAGADGPQFLTVDIPPEPGDVGNLILARASDARIVIDRVFDERDGLRLFAIVNGGATATIDLLDAGCHVVRTLGAPLQPGSGDEARQLDVTVPLDNLDAGAYRLRVTVAGVGNVAAQETAFHVRRGGSGLRQA
jgi:hypothetical protein